jgi:tetratricopeptide (TPR) repeat protein
VEYGKEEAKASWIDKIDRALFSGDYARADDLLETALLETPEDGELIRLKEQIQEASQRQMQAKSLLDEGQRLASAGDRPAAVQKLRAARELRDSDPAVRDALKSVLVEHARFLTEQDWRSALPFIEEALEIDPADPEAASVARLVEDVRQREQIDRYLMEARELQTSRKLQEALENVEQALREYPNEIRLSQLRNTLRASLARRHSDQQEDPQFPVPKPEESQSRLKATDIVSPHPDGLPAIRCPLPGQQNDMPTDGFRRRRAVSTADDSLLDGFSFQTKLAAALTVLVLIGIGLLLSARHKAAVGSAPVADRQAAVKLQAPRGADASQRTTEPATAPRSEDTPKTDPLPLSTQLQPARVPGPVSFHFGSNPAPARVVVDGDDRLTCLTPCELPLTRGRHTFLMSAPSYNPVQRIVQVPEDTTAFAALTEDLITVRLTSVPSGVALFVDGEPKGQTPLTLRLAVGQHKIRTTKDDTAKESTIDVTPDNFVFNISLNATAQ